MNKKFLKLNKKIFFLFFLCIIFLLNIEVQSKSKLDKKPIKFDSGSEKSNVSEGAILLSGKKIYNEDSGFGWIIKPEYEFERKEFSRSRSDFTIDGVTGKALLFKADLQPGNWFITIWVEAGLEDSSTTKIILNDLPQELNWQIFTPPSEPRKNIQKMYRIFSGSFNITDKPFELNLESVLDSVRLLGFTLIPENKNLPEVEKKILSEIERAGKYNSDVDLKNLSEKFKNILSNDPENSFAFYWEEQIELLIEAENLHDMMGWEWAKAKTGMGIFDRYPQLVMLLDAIVNQKKSPFYERALWLRSKVLYWLDLERGAEHEEAASSKGLKELYQLYPDDQILAMYNGKKVDTADKCDSLIFPDNAPLWSQLQHESLCRLQNEIDWWVNVEQAPNGELGGKLGDDVEILRGWHPAILSGNKTALKGWERLADCVWESPDVYKGYAKDADDVEHSSEFISDTTPELVFFTDDKTYVDRLKFSADYFKNFWTGIADNGKRYFKSAWFSSTKIDSEPPKNRDVEMNARAAKAVRYYAWKTGDEETIEAMHEWALGWVDAALRDDKGKPVGIFPASISFPLAEINGDENNWYDADMYWGYFNWRHNAGSKMYDQLLFTYLLTEDSTLLQPLLITLKLIENYSEELKGDSFEIEIGSGEWAAFVLKRKKEFWNSVEQYRFITGDKSFDNLILKFGTPYSKYRITGEIKFLEEALKKYLDNIRYNSPLRTTEVQHTDRVYYPGSETIKAMLSGDGTNEGSSPYYSVSWENTEGKITALVDESGTKKLSVKIFSYATNEQEITMRLWQLTKGDYSLELKTEDGNKEVKNIKVEERGEKISLKIPAKNLVTININQQ